MLFRLENVAREFGGEKLFAGVTAQCHTGNRIGLIGRNGCGKTTLLDLIQGRQAPDQGSVYRTRNLEISRVEQIPRFDSDPPVREAALGVFEDLRRLEARVRELEEEMSRLEASVPPEIADEYEVLGLRLRLHGGYDYRARTEAVLQGLGFTADDFTRPCSRLSGGQQSRLLLAQALLRPSDVLLLDEPTNHLDLDGILWLTNFLREFKSAFLVISHDREFLDGVTARTWEIEGGTLHDYAGSFTQARRLRAEKLRTLEKEYRRQQEWRARTEDFIRRNIAGQKTRQAQSRRKALARTEWIEAPGVETETLRLRIPESRRGGAFAFNIQEGNIGFPGKNLIEGVRLRVGRGERIGILGANGTGKTTLLKVILGELPLLEGKIEWGTNNDWAYFSQSPDLGPEEKTVYDFLRRLDSRSADLELRNLAARFLFRGDDIHKQVGQLSGGERSRLALARLFFFPSNVLVLDEPTNHLDIPGREAVEEALAAYSGTLVIVSHDRYFLRNTVERYCWIRARRLETIDDLGTLSVTEADAKPHHPATTAGAPEMSPASASEASRASETPRLSKNERLRRERRLLELEARIEALETRQKETLAALQQAYQDFAELHRLSDLHQRTQEEIQHLYGEWERLSAELDSVEAS